MEVAGFLLLQTTPAVGSQVLVVAVVDSEVSESDAIYLIILFVCTSWKI